MKLAFLILLTGVALGQITDPHTNNTSGCDGVGSPYAGCSAAFPGASDTAGNVGIQTTVVDAAPGNVSPASFHSLIYGGWTGRVLCHYMPWFYPTSPHITSPGMDETQQNTVTAQVNNMIARGCDAIDIDWYGTAGPAQRLTVTSHVFTAATGTSFKVAITEDEGAITPTCPLNGGGTTQAAQVTCISNAIIADMDYIHTNYAGSANYLLSGSNPEVFFFMDLTDWTNPVLDAAHRQSIWTAVKAHTAAYGTPFKLLFEQGDYTTSPDGGGLSDGNYGWAKPYTYDIVKQFCWDVTGTGCAGTEYVGTMYAQFIASAKLNQGLFQAGFDDNIGSFGSNRVTAQRCGQTLQETAAAFNTALSGSGKTADLMMVTWNDYEEGTEFETGIGNCYTVSQSISGTTLTPTLNKTDATYSTISTIDHLKVIYKTAGGSYFTAQDNIAPATASISLIGLLPIGAPVTVYTQAVGIAGIQNQISAGTLFLSDAYFAQASAGANDGTSCANARALSSLVSGDWGPDKSVHVCGTITSTITVLTAGSSGHPTRLVRELGAKFSKPSWGNVNVIEFSNKDWVTIEGTTNSEVLVENTAVGSTSNPSVNTSGIDAIPTNNSTVQNVWMHNFYVKSLNDGVGGGDETHMAGSNNRITNSVFDNAQLGPTIDYFAGSTGGEIDHNTVSAINQSMLMADRAAGATSNGMRFHDNTITPGANWDDLTVITNNFHHNCVVAFINNDTSSITGLQIYNNQCVGDPGQKTTGYVFLDSEGNGSGTHHSYDGTLIFNNTFGDTSNIVTNTPTNGFIITKANGGSPAVSMYDNTMQYLTTNKGYCARNQGAVLTNENNIGIACLLNINNSSGSVALTDYNDYYLSSGSSVSEGVHSITGNPNINASFFLLAGSPAIGAGKNLFSLGIPNLNLDKAGTLRSASLPWDMGAYAFANSGPGGTIINNAILNNVVTQ